MTDGASSLPAVAPSAFTLRFSLRLRQAEGIAEVSGFAVDQPMLRSAERGTRLSARLGPDEWWLMAHGPDAVEPAAVMGADLAGHFFSLVDLSHATVGFAVSGEHAAAILNAGCPLDLRDRSFPVGMATRTVLGKAEIILIRQEAASYLVECRRSFATYVAAFLREAARDAGA